MKLRALIVEDCDMMRNLLKEALPLTGLAEWEFTEARDGQEALSRFDPRRTDILFVDWNMPKVTGVDLVRRIRKMPASRRIPIVMVTGLGTVGNITEALDQAGADLYITKPYTVAKLKEQLQDLIESMAAKRPQPVGSLGGLLGRVIRSIQE